MVECGSLRLRRLWYAIMPICSWLAFGALAASGALAGVLSEGVGGADEAITTQLHCVLFGHCRKLEGRCTKSSGRLAGGC